MDSFCLYNATVFTGITVLQKGAVIIKDGIIDDVISDYRFHQKTFPADMKLYDMNGANISAGFIDTHIHGIKGFGTEDRNPEAIIEMSRGLVDLGVTAFCPTLYPESEEDMTTAIKAIATAMGKESGARILGMHLEGPFISAEKLGVQRPEFIKPVDLDLMKRLWEAAEGKITNMTVAPELKNMRELALYCTKKGITLQAGHSNATYDHMVEGMQAGILHSTHFFNAMRKLHHRDPGVAGAIMIHPEVSCELIADGFHVHPAIIKLLMREKHFDKIVLVTDALKPTYQTCGDLIANGEGVYLDDNVFRRKKDDVIAGSSLTMMKGVSNLVGWGIPLELALHMASSNPAEALKLPQKIGSLIPGHRADVIAFDENFKVMLTAIDGKIGFKDF